MMPGRQARSGRKFFSVRSALAAGAALVLSGCTSGASTGGNDNGPGSSLVYPRVLFLTTGADGAGLLPSGANICLETFNGLGAFAEVADKSVLLDRGRLDSVRIIVAPTIAGYHDADRVFSLSFLDRASMVNLADWVRSGGILVAGENIGRNTVEGEDRVASGNLLAESEWPLARVFGYEMTETNLAGFRLAREPGAPLLDCFREELSRPFEEAWVLVPVEPGAGVRVLASWTDGQASHPAVTLNPCGRGFGVLVPYFLLLQPSVDGGAGDVSAIAGFYRGLFALALGDGPEVFVNPWPGPFRAALAVTLNETGESLPAGVGTERFLARLFAVPGLRRADAFVSGGVPDTTLDLLRREPRVNFASLSFSRPRFSDLDYCRTVWEIARLENLLGQPVTGFRFPFSSRTAGGLLVLSQRGYRYDSSIFVDHATGFAGALFPYNLPAWVRDHYCLVTGLLELSPMVEDWEFFGAGAAAPVYPVSEQARDARRFAGRLETNWRDLARTRRGMMILSLHAAYSGFSETTLEPVAGFLAESAATGDAWLAGMDEVVDWWSARRNVDIRVRAGADRTVLGFTNSNPEPVRGLTLRLEEPGLRARATGVKLDRVERIEEDGNFTYLIFDLATTAEVEVYR